MAHDGIAFNASELPRSFRGEPETAATDNIAAVATDEVAVTPRKKRTVAPSPYAGTSLDFQKGLQEYKKKKSKA
jgi:hypothetical protein